MRPGLWVVWLGVTLPAQGRVAVLFTGPEADRVGEMQWDVDKGLEEAGVPAIGPGALADALGVDVAPEDSDQSGALRALEASFGAAEFEKAERQLQELHRALEGEPPVPGPQRLEVWLWTCALKRVMGDEAGAEEAARRVVELDPDYRVDPKRFDAEIAALVARSMATGRVSLELNVRPASATVWVDAVRATSGSLSMEPSKRPRQVAVSARGYRPVRRALPEGEKRIEVRLPLAMEPSILAPLVNALGKRQLDDDGRKALETVANKLGADYVVFGLVREASADLLAWSSKGLTVFQPGVQDSAAVVEWIASKRQAGAPAAGGNPWIMTGEASTGYSSRTRTMAAVGEEQTFRGVFVQGRLSFRKARGRGLSLRIGVGSAGGFGGESVSWSANGTDITVTPTEADATVWGFTEVGYRWVWSRSVLMLHSHSRIGRQTAGDPEVDPEDLTPMPGYAIGYSAYGTGVRVEYRITRKRIYGFHLSFRGGNWTGLAEAASRGGGAPGYTYGAAVYLPQYRRKLGGLLGVHFNMVGQLLNNGTTAGEIANPAERDGQGGLDDRLLLRISYERAFSGT